MPSAEPLRLRLRTAKAMAALCRAQLVVALIPFHRWRRSLGAAGDRGQRPPGSGTLLSDAQRYARHVDRAAEWLPFTSKCLPRAIALSWMLRSRGIRHAVVFAVRPAHLRDGADSLHAWVEFEGTRIIGDLPGPWLETLRLGS